jgi:predicted AlkP superfamily pyrophosphatase or phosphodiesterase
MRLKHGCFTGGISRTAFIALIAIFFGGCGKGKDVPIVYQKDMQFDARPQMVIIASFDGLRPDAIGPSEAGHLQSLANAGVVAKSARTIEPSLTLPSHSSMLSGVSPAKHGILWNGWDPSKGLIRVPTLFDEAKKKGLRTAMIAGKIKFAHLNHPGSIDRFIIREGDASEIAEVADKTIRELRPQLLFIHFAHADNVGHKEGWMTSDQFDAIHEADQALGQIFHTLVGLNLLASTAVIATADHGGSGKGHGDASDVSVSIPWFAVGAGIPRIGTIDHPITTYDTAATAAALLDLPIPASWDGKSAF